MVLFGVLVLLLVQMHQKLFGTQILERPANKLVLLVESENENNIEQWDRTQDDISWGEECVDEKLYEWTL